MTIIWFRPCVWATLALLSSAVKHIRAPRHEALQEVMIEDPHWKVPSHRQLKSTSKKTSSLKTPKTSADYLDSCLDADQDVCGYTTNASGEVEDMVTICVLDNNKYRSKCVKRSERMGETLETGEVWQGCGCCYSRLGLGSKKSSKKTKEPYFCSLPEPQCPGTLVCPPGEDGLLQAEIYYWDTSKDNPDPNPELKCVDPFFKDNDDGEDVIFCGNTTHGFALTDDCDKNDDSRFNICLYIEYIDFDPIIAYTRTVKARDLWESVIVEDDGPPTTRPDDLGELGFFSANGLVPKRFPTSIDDIAIAVFFDYSPRRTIGVAQVAGTKTINSDGQDYTHAYAATFFINTQHFDTLEAFDPPAFDTAIEHEMGHTLGIGTLWVQNNLWVPGERKYEGTIATAKWNAIGCSGFIPTERNGAHFDETCLNPELMTGGLERAEDDILSAVTIGALEDLGFGVDYANAESFELSDIRGARCQGEFTDFVTCPEGTASRVRRLDEEGEVSEGGYLDMMMEAGKQLQAGCALDPSSERAIIILYYEEDTTRIYDEMFSCGNVDWIYYNMYNAQDEEDMLI